MKALEGSEKQVKWAEKIREDWAARADILEDDSHIVDYTEQRTIIDPLTGEEHNTKIKGTKVSQQMQDTLEKATRHFQEDRLKGALATRENMLELAAKIRDAVENEARSTEWIKIR